MVPAPRLLAMVGALVALAVAAGFWPPLLPAWYALAGALALAAAADAWRLRGGAPLRVERQMAGVLPTGVWQPVRVTVRNDGARAVALELFDAAPSGWELEGMPHAARLAPEAWLTVTYRVRPPARGDAAFGAAWLRVAGKQGDAAGAMTFGGATRWLAPAKGRAGLDRLLAGLYDVHPDETAPDYPRAANDLLQRLPRRAFVVLITNVRDEDDTALRAACDLLAERHLVLCASLREHAVDAAAQAPVTDFTSALRLAAAERYLQQRGAAIRRLGLRHDRFVDVTPARLGVALLNRYLDIKESGVL